jgi:hypothetical protein
MLEERPDGTRRRQDFTEKGLQRERRKPLVLVVGLEGFEPSTN